MRVLLLAQFFPPDIGGEERHVLNLANTLADRGHEVAVATQRLDDVPDREVLASGVRVHRFATTAMRLPGVYSSSRAHHPPVPDPLGARELARIVRDEHPDVVHAHNWIVNSALALRRHSAAKPRFGLVLTLHDYSQVCATKRLMRADAICPGPKASRCLPCASAHYGPIVGPVTVAATSIMRAWKERAIDHIISVSQAVADRNRIPDGPSSSVIPNFVLDSALLPPIDDPTHQPSGDTPFAVPKDPFVLFVGELSHEKGLHTLLRAHGSLGKHRPALMLVGRRTSDTPTRLPDGVEMHLDWPHEHVLAAFQHCLMAVLPSVWPDPCPTTVLEAMASGRPVIASSVGGVVDMIADGTSGLLVPPGDTAGLAVAIDRLLADEDLRARLGASAKVAVGRFTASVVAERLEAVYARVVPRGQSTAGTAALAARDEQSAQPGMRKNSTPRRLLVGRE
jgi:glycosyltransferase involved in cell wall biosynthesis